MTRPGRTLTLTDNRDRRATFSALVQRVAAPETKQILTVRHFFRECADGHPVSADFEGESGIVHRTCGSLERRSANRDLALIELEDVAAAIPVPVGRGKTPRLWPQAALGHVSGKRCQFRGSQTGDWTSVIVSLEDEEVLTGTLAAPPLFGDSGGPLYFVDDDEEYWLVGLLVEHVGGLDRFLHPGRGMDDLGVELWKE